jgi:hypothetical protein
MLKIIIIVAGYTLNNFTNSYHNTIVDDGNLYNFKTKKQIHFFTHTHTHTNALPTHTKKTSEIFTHKFVFVVGSEQFSNFRQAYP